MSNTTGVPVNHRTLVRRTVSLHQPGYVVSVSPAAPVSRSEAAPCGRASRRWPCLHSCELAFANSSRLLRIGGAYRDRTDDLMLAKQPLSQLS